MSEKQKIFFGKLEPFLKRLQQELANIDKEEEIPLFYEPIHYVLQLPGKRIRPLLTILSALTCGGTINDAFFPAAALSGFGIESIFHDIRNTIPSDQWIIF